MKIWDVEGASIKDRETLFQSKTQELLLRTWSGKIMRTCTAGGRAHQKHECLLPDKKDTVVSAASVMRLKRTGVGRANLSTPPYTDSTPASCICQMHRMAETAESINEISDPAQSTFPIICTSEATSTARHTCSASHWLLSPRAIWLDQAGC